MRAWLLAFLCACSSTPAMPTKMRPPTKASAEQEARASQLLTGKDWYRHAVVYEVNVRSFSDSNGDGIGDLAGLTSRLDYLKGLGVDAIWLMPIMPSPFKDSGYDVADYRNIDPAYGDLAAFDALLSAAHARKMRVIIDLVLNHTSSQHAWFQDSRSSKTSAHADWYVWSDTPSRADIGTCGPFNPTFGDNAWTLDPTRNQYYFHRFYPDQPDLDYRNPAVVSETLDIAKFWLEKGVDGFRCDVIGVLYESPQGCELVPETIDYIKKLRALLDKYPDRAMVAEAGLASPVGYFGNGTDMFHLAFDFPYGYFWNLAFAGHSRTGIDNALMSTSSYPMGAQDATVIGSHDVPRAWVRANGVGSRQRRAAEISMFMRGTPFVYYGEEIGMRHGNQIVVDNRDYQRTPMLWDASPNHAFTTGKPWLAFSEGAETTNVDIEDKNPDSMLTFYRQLLAFRRGHEVWGTGAMKLLAMDNPSILAFTRESQQESYLVLESLEEIAVDGSAQLAWPGKLGELVWGEGKATFLNGTLNVSLPAEGSAVFKLY